MKPSRPSDLGRDEPVLDSSGPPGTTIEPNHHLIDHLTFALAAARVSALPDTVVEVLTADPDITAATLWVLDVSADNLADAQRPERRESVTGSAVGQAVSTDMPVVAERSAIFPLEQRGHIMGALEVEGPDPATLANRLPSVARMVARELVASHHYGDALDRCRNAHGMTVTATIQHSLLPLLDYRDDIVEIVGRLEPAYEVAGDFYDYAVNPEGVHVGVFDAVGHDLRSSILATLTAATYRRGRRAGADLAGIASEIDSMVQAFEGRFDFVTGLMAVLETAAGKLHLWNAGHPDPLLVREGKVTPLSSSQRSRPMGLGVSDGSAVSFDVRPGDLIAFYSDGVVEARDPDRREWGVPRLGQCLADPALISEGLHHLAKTALDTVVHHVESQLSDDAALLLLRCSEPQT